MTRNSNRERVVLGGSEWLKIAGLVFTLVGAAWNFTLNITGRLTAVETNVTAIKQQIDELSPIGRQVSKQ